MRSHSRSLVSTSLVHCALVAALLVINTSDARPEPEKPVMERTLHEIARWLAVEYGLPVVGPLPRVVLVENVPDRFAVAAAGADIPQRLLPSNSLPEYSGIEAFYSTLTGTIYLSSEWEPQNPRDTSILVHEMVHHVQNRTGMRFACAGERERLAFDAQERWLRAFGTDLETEFGIDGLTLIVRTNCVF